MSLLLDKIWPKEQCKGSAYDRLEKSQRVLLFSKYLLCTASFKL